ncbi:MAG TPA: hypothetical protein VL202_23585, partial [Pararhizobium sp.]|uniref:hypothetical protein n=1 Tax=Pararhizobium sp. TaxID=1977563 RepID=UPI002C975FF3
MNDTDFSTVVTCVGNDTLSGGLGIDKPVSGADDDIFTKAGSLGDLAASAFHIGTRGHDTN